MNDKFTQEMPENAESAAMARELDDDMLENVVGGARIAGAVRIAGVDESESLQDDDAGYRKCINILN